MMSVLFFLIKYCKCFTLHLITVEKLLYNTSIIVYSKKLLFLLFKYSTVFIKLLGAVHFNLIFYILFTCM